MQIKTLGVVVAGPGAGPGTDPSPLAAAASLALRLGAHVDALALGIEPVPIEAYSMGTVALATRSRNEAMVEAEAAAALARGLFEAVSCEVEPLVVPSLALGEVLARRLRFVDLVVSGRPYGADAGRNGGPIAATVIEAALFGAGVPVLVVPDGTRDLSRAWDRVVLAWDDGEQALAAVRAALPVLRAASQVDVVLVDPPARAQDRADPGGAVALWLARQGVRAEVAVLARTEPTVAGVLARFARERGAEAIALGAYGHSRLREAMLGGVTRDLLASVPLPLVLAR